MKNGRRHIGKMIHLENIMLCATLLLGVAGTAHAQLINWEIIKPGSGEGFEPPVPCVTSGGPRDECCRISGGYWDNTSDFQEEHHCVCPTNMTVTFSGHCRDTLRILFENSAILENAERQYCDSRGGTWIITDVLWRTGVCDCAEPKRWINGLCQNPSQ